jgi:hypothetical protein
MGSPRSSNLHSRRVAWSYEPWMRFHASDLHSEKPPLQVGASHSRSLPEPLLFVTCRDDAGAIH